MTTGHGTNCQCAICARPRKTRARRSLIDQISHAEAEASRHLGNYNDHVEAGREHAAKRSGDAAQRWLDRANDLRGNGSGR